MTWARRTDDGHAAIVAALRATGFHVADLSRLGDGVPDLLVRRGWGRYVLMEVKGERGKLTAAQHRFLADWPEIVVVRSVEQALAEVGLGSR